MKYIFLTGQCSLHWGRMEFGNIGNYYILEPLIENLIKKYPDYDIITTLQLSNFFLLKYKKVKIVNLEIYYDFNNQKDNLNNIQKELLYSINNKKETPYIKLCKEAEHIYQFDGDMWGDNADLFGKDKALCGYLKSLIAQNCNKNVYMIAGSPGPFKNNKLLVKNILKNFNKITNREEISNNLIKNEEFNLNNIYHYPCPSFQFKHNVLEERIQEIKNIEDINEKTIGFILCGWNLPNGSFDDKKRDDKDFNEFIKFIEYILNNYDFNILLISHNNAFIKEPFELIRGRDYDIIKQLYKILLNKNTNIKKRVKLQKGIYNAHETKALLSTLYINISGRLHGSVGSLTENVPTLMIKYDNGPPCHKLDGFMNYIKLNDYICSPNLNDLSNKFNYLIKNYNNLKKELKINLEKVKLKIKYHF